jgi:DNA-binding SARP family transcriptional activator
VTEPATRTVRHTVTDVVGSVVTALLAFAATPTVLIVVVGNPLTSGLGHSWTHPARITLTALTCIAWVSWAACCAQLVRDVAVHVRHGGVASGAFSQRVAARIAVGILAVSALISPLAMSTQSGATVNVSNPMGARAGVTPSVSSLAPDEAQSPTSARYVVQAGDSLWTIAETHLGDGADWTAIAALNLGHPMGGGHSFVDPSVILPGWTLRLPIEPGTQTAPPRQAEAVVVDLVRPVPTFSVLEHAIEDIHLPGASAPQPHLVRPDQHLTRAPDGGAKLPEVVALGLGAICCAALARRSRRQRILQQLAGGDPGARSSEAIDTDALLSRFDSVPALRAFERANCRLRQALETRPVGTTVPGVRAVCVGSGGVDFWLTSATDWAPGGFSLRSEGEVWHIAHGALSHSESLPPQLPIALTVGDDDDGTWLVPLYPGACVPLLGEAAGDLARAMRTMQESWLWSDAVLVTDDPVVANAVTPSRDLTSVLFFGDPAALSPSAREVVATVTVTDQHASDLTVVVDHRAATLHPLGRVVRPHLLEYGTSLLLRELVETPLPVDDPEEMAPPTSKGPVPDRHSLLTPGTVEVRLLSTSPRLEGLREELPANRARRAVELVAYLALHRPDDVTSDRLRTRVLGSSDADAAAKTLFNIAAAARRAMGVGAHGHALLPSGSRTGHYRISEEVTVDVHRACDLAAFGNACEDPDAAMAHLRAALGLIEGEPLANVLSGYTWWEAEGHGARLAAVMVNAACNLAALAVEAGHFDLAQWGLAQARLVDPYSESLSRAAMQVAAAGGDADRLRREWRECQRRIDELDPGSTPSPRTERLYGELAQGVLVSPGAT